MTDILRQLTRASWRDIEFPVTGTRQFGFVHDQEKHRFIFRDTQLIESLGRENPTFRYTIPFREEVIKHPWVKLFTDVYPTFLEACLDRSTGTLIDPVHGPQEVKCASLSEVLDVNKKDGVDVDVEFILAPDEEFLTDAGINLSTVEGAEALQGALDRDVQELDPETQAELDELNKGSERGRLNPLDFATSVLDQVEANGNKINAAFGDVIFRAEKLDASLSKARDPKTEPMRQNARRLALVARDLQRTAIQGKSSRNRVVSNYKVPAPIGKIALAGRLGNTVQELIRLNPTIARLNTVPAESIISYYR